MEQKYAKLTPDGLSIDSITYYPDRILVPAVPAKLDGEGNILIPAIEEHWGDLVPGIIPVDAEVFAGYVKQGPNWVAPATPPKPVDQMMAEYKYAFDMHLDRVAQARQYDSRLTIVGYTTSRVDDWANEANAFIAWRDEALSSMFVTLDKFRSGEIEQPTIEEFIASLPAAPWALGE